MRLGLSPKVRGELMTGLARRTKFLVIGTVSVLMASAALLCLPGPAAAAASRQHSKPKNVVLLKHVAYYTVNNGSTFCRYTTPQSSVPLVGTGTASQARNRFGNGHVILSISQATGYADDGFYESVGTLGDLVGYMIRAKAAFGSNLWLDTNTANDTGANGNFFSWSAGCLSSTDGDDYGLGPTSVRGPKGQVSKVSASSTFALTCNAVYQSVTLAQLQAGYCAGISPTTQAAVWIGITVGSGGSLTTKIRSGHTQAH
jgi:hypothetical protein